MHDTTQFEEKNEFLYLLKLGELMLKRGNRDFFNRRLLQQLRTRFPEARIRHEHGRIYLGCSHNIDTVGPVLQGLFGITAAAAVQSCAVQQDPLCRHAEQLVAQQLEQHPGALRFKVDVRRVNKSIPQRSYHYACLLGEMLQRKWPRLIVDLRRPDWVLHLELRQHAWLYLNQWAGPGGLPYGISGRGLLLLSGGIDSPVAGYLMGKRGLAFDMIYFDTPPYTDERARDKVEQLARRLAFFGDGRQRLCVFPFTPLQLAIKERTEARTLTLMSRATMVRIAGLMAEQRGLQALISGESLAQVASQTLDNMRFTASTSTLPMLRPLIGFDKQDIIRIARRIESYDISIQPFDDCCSVFAADKPVLHAQLHRAQQELAELRLDELIAQGTRQARWQRVVPSWQYSPVSADYEPASGASHA